MIGVPVLGTGKRLPGIGIGPLTVRACTLRLTVDGDNRIKNIIRPVIIMLNFFMCYNIYFDFYMTMH